MAEERKYTIVVKKDRVEVSREVYYAYHQAREAERYQMQVVHQKEMSLERFQEEGVNVEYRLQRQHSSAEELFIAMDDKRRLHQTLKLLTEDEYLLISELFFEEKSVQELSAELGVPRMTLHDRKQRILKKLVTV